MQQVTVAMLKMTAVMFRGPCSQASDDCLQRHCILVREKNRCGVLSLGDLSNWGDKGKKKRQIHRHIEKLGLGWLGSLPEKSSPVETQHIYYILLSKEVGLLHTAQWGVRLS